ncbi:MAG: serine protease [Candidatus Paceibacterota bacterium]|jgi:hypothetical protein
MDIKFDKFEEQIFLNTVLIKNTGSNILGTGFLLQKPTLNGRAKFILFSNKHVFWGEEYQKVADNAENHFEITLHNKDADGSYKLEKISNFRFKINKSSVNYFEHPNPDIDIACVNISAAFNQPGITLNVRAIEIDKFIDFDLSTIHCGQKVVFIGYPTGFFDKKNFLPIMRSGIIASIPDIDFQGKQQILIDAQVFPGSSGSPVFVEVGGKYKLLGIISDGVIKELGFTKIKKTGEAEDEKYLPIEFIGLGLVFKYTAIKEVYDAVPVPRQELASETKKVLT